MGKRKNKSKENVEENSKNKKFPKKKTKRYLK